MSERRAAPVVEGPAALPEITQEEMDMTEENARGFDEVLNSEEETAGGFGEILKRLNSMTRKPCNECGQVFRGLDEEELCTECGCKRDHPEARDMYWTWSRAGRGSWGIVAYWPDGEPMPEPGDRVTVNRRDGSTSIAVIHEVEGLRYLPTGRAQLRCMVE